MKTMTIFKGAKIMSTNELVDETHREYVMMARCYKILYYVTRIIVGLSAALLTFTVQSSVRLSTAFSIIIFVITIIDFIVAPKEKWVLYSKATDLLTVAKIKARGEYEKNKEALDVIVKTEAANLQRLIDLDDLVSKVNEAHSHRTTK